MHKMGLSDAGTEKFIATGSVRMHKQGLGSSGKETEAGSGSVAMHKQRITAYQATVISGTASVSRHKMSVAADGDPASIRLDNSAEGGTNGATVTTGNSGGASGSPLDIVSIGSLTTFTYDNSHPANGGMGYKYVTGSPAATVVGGWSTSMTSSSLRKVFGRKYYYIPSLPSGNLRLLRAMSSSTLRACVAVNSSGHIVLIQADGTTQKTSTTTVSAATLFRLEAKFIGDASAGQIECLIFKTDPHGLVPDETVTSLATLNTGGTINRVDWGNPSSIASFTFYGDVPCVSTRGYPGPVPRLSVARHKMGLGASGNEKFIATGSARMHKMGLSSSGKETEAGTGSVRMHKMGISAAGTLLAPVTGSVQMHKMGISATARETEAGTASVRLAKMGVAGIGVETFFITGGVRLRKMGVSGSGLTKLSFHLHGGVTMHKMQILGQHQPIDPAVMFVFAPV
jgi:hypothetical protein